MTDLTPESFNKQVLDEDGNLLEEWSVDKFGHMTRSYMIPKKSSEETESDMKNEQESMPQITAINIGNDFDDSEFPAKISTELGEYRRDDAARKIGKQWISGIDRKRIAAVPAKVNLSLRKWNGLSSRTRDQLSSMLVEMDKETLDDIGSRGPAEWDEIVSGFVGPQKKLAKHFLTNRPRQDFDPNDLMSFVAELDNFGFAESQSMSSEEDLEMSQTMKTRIEAWKISREKQINNPSYSLLSGPRLSMDELDEWTDAAVIGIASSLREATDVLELSLNDKLPENLFDRIARRYLTEQEPPFASFDDFEMAVDMVKGRFGYPISIDVMIEEGLISGKDEDMILSGKLIELMELGDLGAIEPKIRKAAISLMKMMNVQPDVPEQVPNDTISGNFRPYISPSSM